MKVLRTDKSTVVILALAVAISCVAGAVVFGNLDDYGNSISYETNGGKLSGDYVKSYTTGEQVELPVPEKDRYVFRGWYLDEELTYQFDGNMTGLIGKIVLYASWDYDLTGHKLTMSKSGTYSTSSGSYTISGTFEYTYLNYNTDKKTYYVLREDTTTYTNRMGKSATDSDSSELWEDDEDLSYKGLETISTIKGDIACNVYMFSNAYEEKVLWVGVDDGIVYKIRYFYDSSSFFSRTVKSIIYELTSDEIVTIKKDQKLTVIADDKLTIKGNEGYYAKGTTVTLEAVPAVGESFRGWFDDDGNILSYETKYSFIITKDITLVAHLKEWFTVSYEMDGGTTSETLPEKYSPGTSLTLPIPVRDQDVFGGWYLDPEFENYFDGDTSDLDGNITLYAYWEENLTGHTLTLKKEGTYNRGINSCTISGTLTFTYMYFNFDKQSYYIKNSDYTKYTYTYISGQDYEEETSHLYWSSEVSGTWQYLGTEVIDVTIDGKIQQMECYVNRLTYTNGGVETQWSNGWKVYKIEYEYNSYSIFTSNSRTVTYTYVSDGMIEIEKDCDITVVSGEGIEVKGNKSPYQLGETATLEAVVDKNVEFGGWYDENNTLLSNTKKYEFVVTGSQTIYAINANVLDGTFDSDIPIDLDAEFGLTDATYTITNSDTEDKDEYVKGLYTFDNGGKYTIIAKDSDGSYKFFTVKITGGVERTYEWKCDNITYTLTMDIDYDDFLYSRDLYDISKRQQQSSHVRDKTFVTYSYTDSTMAPYMETLVNALYEKYMATHSTVTEIGYLNYILAFTQYIEYQYDEEAMGVEEYWKFPLETLYDQGGDCEDTSILFVAIAHQSRSIIGFNYEVAMQLLPGHMCGAIKLSGSSASYKTNPSGYIYCETTTTDYRIGEIPKSNNMEAYFTQATYYNNGYSATVEIA